MLTSVTPLVSRPFLLPLISLLLLVIPVQLHAQTASSFPYAKPAQNDSATGTTQFTLTKINSSGNAVITASSPWRTL
jgi:hypothetical protein